METGQKCKITVVEFFVFGSKSQKAFIDKTDEQIHAHLKNICNTNSIISFKYFDATHLETKIVNEEEGIAPTQPKKEG